MPSSRFLSAGLLGLLVSVAVGCGDDPARTEQVTASQDVPSYCYGADLRLELARRPPRYDLQLRNSDMNNFLGRSEYECNQREIVFAGLRAPTADEQRLATVMRFHFKRTADDARGSARTDRRSTDAITVDGERIAVFATRGALTGRFVFRAAVVDIIVACLPPGDSLVHVPCRRPPRPRSDLQPVLERAAQALIARLRELP